MNDTPRLKLIEIVAWHGKTVIDNPGQLQGLLMDHCGECPREIHALIDAVRERIPQDLCAASGGIPLVVAMANLTQRLLEKRPMAEDMAVWVVETWAIALGVSGSTPTPPPTVATKPSHSPAVPVIAPQPTPVAVKTPLPTHPSPMVKQSSPSRTWIWLRSQFAGIVVVVVLTVLMGGWFVLSRGWGAAPYSTAIPSLSPAAPTVALLPTITSTVVLLPTTTSTVAPPPLPTQESPTMVTLTVLPATKVPTIALDQMALIPAGPFKMGSDQGLYSEEPVHSVTVDTFLIDKYEVTNADYAKCVADQKCSLPKMPFFYTLDDYYSNGKYASYPVLFVSWNDADTYCSSPGSNPPGPTTGETKVVRGGGLNFDLYYARVTNRNNLLLTYRNGDVGFRCVATLKSPE